MNKTKNICDLIRTNNTGVLSTYCNKNHGFPYGSFLPYVHINQFDIIILISDIAEHTKNLNEFKKFSFVINEDNYKSPFEAKRLCLQGIAKKTNQEEFRLRYERFFPDSLMYREFNDFNCWLLEVKHIRYIGGFGNMFWEDVKINKFENEIYKFENEILEHINQDHQDALANYIEFFHNKKNINNKLIGFDSIGINIMSENKNYRINFLEEVTSFDQIRRTFKKLSDHVKKEK